MTRVSTSELFRQATTSLLRQQSAMLDTQQQLASGKRIQAPSDDPTGSARVLGLTSAIESTKQYARNADLATSRLNQEETVLAAVGENLQRVRELTIQAANASQTDATRAGIAAEIEQRLDELIDLANTRDANGEYLFAGYSSTDQPFTRTTSGVQYDGDQGQRFLALSADRQVAVGDSGHEVFVDVPGGNGTFEVDADGANTGSGIIETGNVTDPSLWVPDSYTVEFTAPDTFEVRDGSGAVIAADVPYASDTAIGSIPGIEFAIEGEPATGDRFTVSATGSRDLFATYDELITALRTPTPTAAGDARFQTNMNRALTALDQGLGHVQEIRAEAGARMNSVEMHRSINENVRLDLESSRSGVEDIDYAAAISRFQQQLTAFQAAQASFARIQDLSLFDFIR